MPPTRPGRAQGGSKAGLLIDDLGAPTSTEGELVCDSVVLIRQDLLTADGLSGVSRNAFSFKESSVAALRSCSFFLVSL